MSVSFDDEFRLTVQKFSLHFQTFSDPNWSMKPVC